MSKFVLELHQKQKSILRKYSRFSLIFILFFTALLKTTGIFLLLTPQSTNSVHFPIRKDTVEENSVPKGNDRHKKTHIIVKSIHLSLRSESKILKCTLSKIKNLSLL